MLEAVLSRTARPQGWGSGMGARPGARAFATSRSLEAGSGCISFGPPPGLLFCFLCTQLDTVAL